MSRHDILVITMDIQLLLLTVYGLVDIFTVINTVINIFINTAIKQYIMEHSILDFIINCIKA